MQVRESSCNNSSGALPRIDAQESPEYSCVSVALSHDAAHMQEHASAVAIVSLDSLGMAASTLCLIHCLLMPLVISMLPVLGWQFMASKGAHQLLAAFVIAFALFAIVPGYLKHKQGVVLAGMIAGLSLVLVATFICGYVVPENLEVPMITVGNLILVATHWRNRTLSACRHSH
jgi:hypothetical protein